VQLATVMKQHMYICTRGVQKVFNIYTLIKRTFFWNSCELKADIMSF